MVLIVDKRCSSLENLLLYAFLLSSLGSIPDVQPVVLVCIRVSIMYSKPDFLVVSCTMLLTHLLRRCSETGGSDTPRWVHRIWNTSASRMTSIPTLHTLYITIPYFYGHNIDKNYHSPVHQLCRMLPCAVNMKDFATTVPSHIRYHDTNIFPEALASHKHLRRVSFIDDWTYSKRPWSSSSTCTLIV
jgi:hypothetical protein